MLHVKIPFQSADKGNWNYIHEICFSKSYDLYVLVHEGDHMETIYRICVGFDTHMEVRDRTDRFGNENIQRAQTVRQ